MIIQKELITSFIPQTLDEIKLGKVSKHTLIFRKNDISQERPLLDSSLNQIKCCSCGKGLKESDDGNFDNPHDRIKTSYCQKCIDKILKDSFFCKEVLKL